MTIRLLRDTMTMADVDSAITVTIASIKKTHEQLDALQARLDRLGVYRQMLIAEDQLYGKKTEGDSGSPARDDAKIGRPARHPRTPKTAHAGTSSRPGA